MERLPVTCPACHHPVDPNDAYCAECGDPIVAGTATWTPASPAPPAPAPPVSQPEPFVPLRISARSGHHAQRSSSRRSRPFWRALSHSR